MNHILLFFGNDNFFYPVYRLAALNVGLDGRFVHPAPFNSRMKTMIDRARGLLFCGGGDISPWFSAPGSPPHPKLDSVRENRDILELKALEYALKGSVPVMAICRGFQLLNILFGGRLFQDIGDEFASADSQIQHQQLSVGIPRWRTTHRVEIEPGSLAHSIFRTECINVNSFHHQGIMTLGSGLKITGASPDGLPEIIEIPGNESVLAVQFHPEHLCGRDRRMWSFFRYFAKIVNNYKNRRK